MDKEHFVRMFEDEEFLNAVQKCMDESTCTAAEVADESRMSSHSRKNRLLLAEQGK